MSTYLKIGVLAGAIISSPFLSACTGQAVTKENKWVYSGTYYCIDKKGPYWQAASYDEHMGWMLAGRDRIDEIIPYTPDEYQKCMSDLKRNSPKIYEKLSPEQLADHDWYHAYVWRRGAWEERVKKYGSVEAFIEADKKNRQ